jgi:hypothetical protein
MEVSERENMGRKDITAGVAQLAKTGVTRFDIFYGL